MRKLKAKFETKEALEYWAQAEDNIDSAYCMMEALNQLSDLVLIGDMPEGLRIKVRDLAITLRKEATANGDMDLFNTCEWSNQQVF